MWKKLYVGIGTGSLEDATINSSALVLHLLVHRYQRGEALLQRQANGGGTCLTGLLRQMEAHAMWLAWYW